VAWPLGCQRLASCWKPFVAERFHGLTAFDRRVLRGHHWAFRTAWRFLGDGGGEVM
jgi:hypothetical protein